MNYYQYNSVVGRLLLFSDGRALKKVTFVSPSDNAFDISDNALDISMTNHSANSSLVACELPVGDELRDSVLKEACRQLDEWFAGERKCFDLPLAPDGTDFQKEVWQALQKIPYGTTCSYSDLAKQIGKPQAARAVGAANGQNPIALIIPCHRVIGADGSLTGYAFGVERKKKLLNFEAQHQLRLF